MAPGTVNDSARTLQSELAKFNKDNEGTLTTAGTATAYTLTLNTTPAALADGLAFSATASITNTGGATTLVVTPSGASAFASKKIKVYQAGVEGDPTAGSIVVGNHYLFQYDSAADSATGAYILLNPSSNGLVLLASGTASAAATLDLSLASGYEQIEIVLTNLMPGTTGDNFAIRVSTDNAVSYKSGASDYAYALAGYNDSGSANVTGSAAANAIVLTGAFRTAAALTGQIVVTIPRPTDASNRKPILIKSVYPAAATNVSTFDGSGAYIGAASALTHVRFLFSSGTISTASYRVYGRRG